MSIREILEELRQKVAVHNMALGQEFPDEDPEMMFDPCNAEDVIRAEKALTAYVEEQKLETAVGWLEWMKIQFNDSEIDRVVDERIAELQKGKQS